MVAAQEDTFAEENAARLLRRSIASADGADKLLLVSRDGRLRGIDCALVGVTYRRVRPLVVLGVEPGIVRDRIIEPDFV